jgi:hypothetical protein
MVKRGEWDEREIEDRQKKPVNDRGNIRVHVFVSILASQFTGT